MMIYGFINGIGVFTGPAVASAMLHVWSYQATLYVMGGLIFAVLLLCVMVVPERINRKIHD